MLPHTASTHRGHTHTHSQSEAHTRLNWVANVCFCHCGMHNPCCSPCCCCWGCCCGMWVALWHVARCTFEPDRPQRQLQPTVNAVCSHFLHNAPRASTTSTSSSSTLSTSFSKLLDLAAFFFFSLAFICACATSLQPQQADGGKLLFQSICVSYLASPPPRPLFHYALYQRKRLANCLRLHLSYE